MKKILLLFACTLIMMQFAKAQYVTPGNGTTYTLNDLVTVSGGTVQLVNGTYSLTAALTITSPDVFSVTEDATVICSGGTRINVQGQAQINPPNEVLFISADTVSLANPFIDIYLTENASNSVIRNMTIKFGCGLKISGATNVLIENCTFYKNQYLSTHGSGAITITNCNPIIRNCVFTECVRSAVNSPSNGSVAPTIEGCFMYHNVTSNQNMPQINLGPGYTNDTVKIINNYIKGHVDKSGAISLSTMIGGTIIAIVDNNEIIGNRYGINQYGNNITMFANYNQLIDNNLEPIPNNGGSGITVYSTTLTTKLYASHNTITGNLWGITLIGSALANLGNLEGIGIEYNEGKNIIINNSNEGVEYDLFNNTANAQMAQGNYWGFATAEESEAVIWHQPDNSSLGIVTYAPIYVPETCIGGTKNIPGDYATLEDAVTALNSSEICDGGVTFVLQNGVTYNTAPLTITATGTASTPIIFTTQDINGENAILNVTTTEDAQAAIKLVGSDYVTFNHISIIAANDVLDYGIAFLPTSTTDGCQYNTVSNCNIAMTKNANATYGIYAMCTPTASTGSNSFNTFVDNVITNSYIAVYLFNDQTNSDYFDEGNTIYSSEYGTSIFSNLMMCGVYTKSQKNFSVHHITIEDIIDITGTNNPAGISCIDANPTLDMYDYSYNIYNNTINGVGSYTGSAYGIYFSARKINVNVYNNVIQNVQTTSGDNSTANGLAFTATGTNFNVYNNMISNIEAPENAVSNGPAARGIMVGTAQNANIYFNSVVLDYAATNTAHQCAAIQIYGNTTPYLLQNNIFVNLVTLPEGTTGRAVAYYKRNATLSTNYTNPLCNNNLYYAGTPSATNLIFFGYSSSAPLEDQTLAQFQTRMAAVSANMEQNSITDNPPFVNTLNDLHIVNPNASVAHAGIPVAGITTDIDGNTRDTNNPDLGADEFSSFDPTCLINSLPYFEGFEGEFPTECWSMVYGDEAGTVNPMIHTTDKFYEGTQSYRFSSMDYTSDFNQYLISPEISVTGAMNVSFYYTTTTYGTEVFSVGYSSTGNNITDFTWGETMSINAPNWEEYEIIVPTGTKYVAIHYSSNYSYYLYVDAFTIGEPATCPKPTNLSASPLATSATLNWLENGTATTWNVEYGLSGFAIGTGTLLNNITTNPVSISNLTATTTYDFYVQSVCGTETGEWSNVSQFTTLCVSVSTPFEENFTATEFPYTCWSKMEGLASNAFNGINPTESTSTASRNWNRVTYSCGLTAEHAKINIYGLECKSWMVTPNITLTPNSVLAFDAAYTKYAISETSNDCGAVPTGDINDDKFMVIISTDGGNTWSESNATKWEGDQLLQIPETGTRISIDLSSYSGDIRIAFYGESTQNGGDNDLHIDNIFVGETSSCNPPTNLSALTNGSNIDLTWNAPADRDVLLNETFETGSLPSGWLAIDADGDGYNWDAVTGFNLFVGHSGGQCISSSSYDNNVGPLTPNNYLITPMVNGATSVNYWVCSQDAAYSHEHYGVCASSTGTNASDFTVIFEETMTPKGAKYEGERGTRAQGAWYERTVNLPAGTKYIAFRHFNCTDAFWLNLDDVTVYGGGGTSTYSYKVYQGTTELATVTSTSYTHENLAPGEYCYTVKTVCTDGLSAPSNQACATISGSSCLPPTNLTALTNGSNIDLTWNAPADRDVLLNETFETGSLPSGWLAIDADGDGHNWDAVTGFNLFVGHSGGQCISSSSYDNNVGPLTPNNYLITPMVNGATSVNYWVCAQDAAYSHEHYGVCASSTGTNASDFTVIFEETMTPKGAKYEGERGTRAQGAWYERIVNLPAGTKYIAFRHFNCTDAFWLNLDDVTVYGGGSTPTYSYKVYQGTTELATVTSTSYTHENLAPGEYCYTVKTVCPDGLSAPSNQACATISGGPIICNPPTNLTADATLTGVDLAWDYPGGSPLTWSTAYANNAVGTGGAAEFDCAQRWTVSDLAGYSGKQITSIMFAPHQTTCTFTLKIWTGGSQAAGPAQEVYSQAVATFTPAQENTITLTTPYTIDASQELWVGYHCVATAGHPAGVDAGPAINGKGNMMYFDNAWTTLLELASSLNYNWAIQANVEDNTTFNVYRDGSSIATNLTTLTYSDNSVSVGNHCYTVTANCGTEESDPSNEACVEFFGQCNPTTLTSAQSNGNIVLTWTAVSGAVSYKVYYGSTLIKTTTDLTHTVNNPSIGIHCFTVVTVCATGSSNPSNEACEAIINNINEVSNIFNIYPNPANDKVTVEGQNIESIAIYNIIGQVMNNVKVVDEASKVINTSSFENGVYIFRINTIDGNSIQKRIIIAH